MDKINKIKQTYHIYFARNIWNVCIVFFFYHKNETLIFILREITLRDYYVSINGLCLLREYFKQKLQNPIIFNQKGFHCVQNIKCSERSALNTVHLYLNLMNDGYKIKHEDHETWSKYVIYNSVKDLCSCKCDTQLVAAKAVN